jgi:hypothetical protein
VRNAGLLAKLRSGLVPLTTASATGVKREVARVAVACGSELSRPKKTAVQASTTAIRRWPRRLEAALAY